MYAGMCNCQVKLYMDVYKVQVYAGKNIYILYIALYCGNGYISLRCRGNIITRIEITTKYMCNYIYKVTALGDAGSLSVWGSPINLIY